MQKIFKILVAAVSLIGIVSLGRIISTGDDEILAASLEGDTAIVEWMAWPAYIMLGLVLAFVLFFVVENLFTNTAGLKNTLIGVGAFVAVLVIAYLVSGGDAKQYLLQEGGFATEGTSQLVGAGLVAFYLLIVIAAGAMILSSVKKVISK